MDDRQKWLEWRQKGIGSSDAGIIMGVSPWGTKLKLYEQKIAETVEEDTDNQYVKELGNEAEPKIRSLFELVEGESFSPALLVMEDFDFLRASLDGRSTDAKRNLEIKLSGKDDWSRTKDETLPVRDRVPEKYWPQLQHGLMVSKADSVFYVAYLYSAFKENRKKLSLENLAYVEVKPDEKYIATMLQEEIKFWDCVQNRKPPMADNKDFVPLTGLSEASQRWKDLKENLSLIDDEYNKKTKGIIEEIMSIEKMIIDEAKKKGFSRYLCAGLKVVQSTRQGSISYTKIPEVKKLISGFAEEYLNKYRGKGSVSWKITPMEEK